MICNDRAGSAVLVWLIGFTVAASPLAAQEPIEFESKSTDVQQLPVRIWSAAYSPDGKLIATSSGIIWIVDSQRGRIKVEQAGHDQLLFGVAISPDGKTVASASEDGTLKVWSVVPNDEAQPAAEATAE